jgi:hypothetical protein
VLEFEQANQITYVINTTLHYRTEQNSVLYCTVVSAMQYNTIQYNAMQYKPLLTFDISQTHAVSNTDVNNEYFHFYVNVLNCFYHCH